MDRRSFFRRAGFGAGAGALALVGAHARETAANEIASVDPPPRMTAVSVPFCLHAWHKVHKYEATLPEDFALRGIGCSCHEPFVTLRVLDEDDGPLIEIDCASLKDGPVELWRGSHGAIRCEIRDDSCCNVLASGVITIYGEMPR